MSDAEADSFRPADELAAGDRPRDRSLFYKPIRPVSSVGLGPLQKTLLERAKDKGHITIRDIAKIFADRSGTKRALASLEARGYLEYVGRRTWKYVGD